MSFQAVTWALAQPISRPTAKLILLCLANYADEDGVCWPSQKRLAADTGVTDRAIRSNLVFLEDAGLIERSRRKRPDGSRNSDSYVLSYRKIIPGVRNETTGLPEDSSDHEPVTEPINSPTGEYSPKQAYADYNERAAELGLGVARKLTPERQRSISQRLKEHGEDGWREALQNLDTGFLRGNNARGWKADLDFLIQPKSFNRLLEGYYHTTGPPRQSRDRMGDDADRFLAEAEAGRYGH